MKLNHIIATKILVNLPVKDLDKSVAFVTKLGFLFNPQFMDEKATCMIVGENIFVMLLVEPFFRTFTRKEITNSHQSTEVLLAIDAGSKNEVKDIVSKAVAAGGSVYMDQHDHGCINIVLQIWIDINGRFCLWMKMRFLNRNQKSMV